MINVMLDRILRRFAVLAIVCEPSCQHILLPSLSLEAAASTLSANASVSAKRLPQFIASLRSAGEPVLVGGVRYLEAETLRHLCVFLGVQLDDATWHAALATLLPSGTGEVDGNGADSIFTITITWDDNRDGNANTSFELSSRI